MFGIFRRRTYLVHKSSQLTYVAFSVVPALVMTIFCLYFISNHGEMILMDSREKPMVPIYELQQSLAEMATESCSSEHRSDVQDKPC